MTTAATSLLGLALPVTGELSGTWGDTVNNSITALLDSAVAGTTTLSADADVTLTTTTLAANQAREAIILWTAAGTVTRNITAPAQSKTYVVLNKSSTQSIVIRGAGPTTGVTVLAGKQAMVAWDGTDFVEVSSGYVDGPATSTDNAVARFDGTDGKLIQNSVVIIADTTGNMSGVGTLGVGAITTSGALVGAASQDAFNTVSTTLNLGGAATTVNIGAATGTLTVANATLAAKAVTATSLTNSALTATRLVYSGTAGLEVDSANLTFNGTILTSTGFAGPLNGTVGATTPAAGAFTTLTTSSTVTLNGGTANGVAYLDGSKVLTTGSALVFDGTGLVTINGGSGANGIIRLVRTGSFPGDFSILAGGQSSTTNFLLYDNTNSQNAYLYLGGASGYSAWYANGTEAMRLNSSGLEVKQSQLIGYSSYAGIGTNGLAVAGNVGIGTSSPAYKLDVNGRISYSGAIGEGSATTLSSSSTNLIFGASATWQTALFYTNGTERARISSDGTFRVKGAGTAGSTDAFQVAGTAPASSAILDSAGNLGLGVTPSDWNANNKVFQLSNNASLFSRSGLTGITQNFRYNASDTGIFMSAGYATLYYQNAGQHIWTVSATSWNGTGSDTASMTQAMTLDASGNLLLGTTSLSAGARADIRGANANDLTDLGAQLLSLFDTSSYAQNVGAGISLGYKFNAGGSFIQRGAVIKVVKENATDGTYASALIFGTTANAVATTEKMRLDSAGNLGLGVTPSAWATLSKGLEVGTYGAVSSNSSTGGAYLSNNAYLSTNNDTTGWVYETTDGATLYKQGLGFHQWSIAASGTAGAGITFTQAMTLDASGGLKTLNTIGVGDTAPATSGAGITFPATQSASSNANTLDDYEEGTFTPTISGLSGGSITYTTQTGRYTKIGRQVTAYFLVVVNTNTNTGGNAAVEMPVAADVAGYVGTLGLNTSINATLSHLSFFSASASLFFYTAGGGTLSGASIPNGANLSGSITYFV